MSCITTSFPYVRDEIARFWAMCGEKVWTREHLERALMGCYRLVMNMKGSPEEERLASQFLDTAHVNFERRAACGAYPTTPGWGS